jgi:hypothetical protein
MSNKRLTAFPIREGVTEISGSSRVVWRDYRWNNCQVTRAWFIRPDCVEKSEIEVQIIKHPLNSPERS